MDADIYRDLATIAGEIWGTQARAHMQATMPSRATGETPVAETRILGYDVYFEIFDKLKKDYKKEVIGESGEAKAPDGEDT